jgi:hypothetical protein
MAEDSSDKIDDIDRYSTCVLVLGSLCPADVGGFNDPEHWLAQNPHAQNAPAGVLSEMARGC